MPCTCSVWTTTAESRFGWADDRCRATLHPESDDYDMMPKDLVVLEWRKYDLAKVVVVDDSPHKLSRHPAKLICVMPFLGDPTDVELDSPARYLPCVTDGPDIRVVDKSRWRKDVA